MTGHPGLGWATQPPALGGPYGDQGFWFFKSTAHSLTHLARSSADMALTILPTTRNDFNHPRHLCVSGLYDMQIYFHISSHNSARKDSCALVCISGTWWRHQMATFSALLTICAVNSPVTGEFPAQRPVARSFDVFFDLRLNKRLSKQWWGWWFETPLGPSWRHCNGISGKYQLHPF